VVGEDSVSCKMIPRDFGDMTIEMTCKLEQELMLVWNFITLRLPRDDAAVFIKTQIIEPFFSIVGEMSRQYDLLYKVLDSKVKVLEKYKKRTGNQVQDRTVKMPKNAPLKHFGDTLECTAAVEIQRNPLEYALSPYAVHMMKWMHDNVSSDTQQSDFSSQSQQQSQHSANRDNSQQQQQQQQQQQPQQQQQQQQQQPQQHDDAAPPLQSSMTGLGYSQALVDPVVFSEKKDNISPSLVEPSPSLVSLAPAPLPPSPRKRKKRKKKKSPQQQKTRKRKGFASGRK